MAEKAIKNDDNLFEWLYPAGYRPYRIRWYDIAIAVALFLIVFIGYVKTLTPSVCAGDSGELTTAVYNLGACHPPGYPLYGILGKLFCFIPVRDIAFRVNMFSAFSAAGTVLFLYLIMIKLLGFNRDQKRLSLFNHVPALAGTFLFAFSLTHWSQAVIGEVYALNALLSAGMLFLMLLWFEELMIFRKEKNLHFAERTTILLAFVMGLSLTDHQFPIWYIIAWLALMALPAIFIIASERPNREKFNKELKSRIPALIIFGILAVVSVAILYTTAYPPNMPTKLIMEDDIWKMLLAIFMLPAYLTGYVIWAKVTQKEQNWVDRFLKIFMISFWLFLFAMTMYLFLVIRARAVAPLAEPKPLSWGDTQRLDILFNHMLRKQYGSPSKDLSNLGGQMKAVLKWNVEQFHLVNILFAGIGLVALYLRDKIWAIFSLGAVLLFSVVVVRYINFATDPRTLSFQEVFFIQEFLMISIYIAFGYQAIMDAVSKKPKEWEFIKRLRQYMETRKLQKTEAE